MKPLIYKTTFKVFNVDIDSERIKLGPNVWIEKSDHFRGTPQSFSQGLFGFGNDLLLRFSKELLNSSIIFKSTATDEQMEISPFDVDDCAYIALAISILYDSQFVVGIEEFKNSREENNPGLGPWVSHVFGQQGSIRVLQSDETKLSELYNFILEAFRQSSFDGTKVKLLNLFARCVTNSPHQAEHLLKLGLTSFLNEKTSTIVNAALLFEHVFTREGYLLTQGVEEWNKNFRSSKFNFDEIERTWKYRNIILHDNATRSQKDIDNWKKQNSYSDLDAINVVMSNSIIIAKQIMRQICSNYSQYQNYRKALP